MMQENTNSYLTFKMDEEIFSIHVSKVLEILEIPPVTKVPKSPQFMRGVINLRGAVLPVIDARAKLSLVPKEDTIDTVVIVLQLGFDEDVIKLGIVVDSVQEVLDFEPEDIQPSPSLGKKFKSEFISGVAKTAEEEFVMLLDIEKVFDTDEVVALKEYSDNEVEA